MGRNPQTWSGLKPDEPRGQADWPPAGHRSQTGSHTAPPHTCQPLLFTQIESYFINARFLTWSTYRSKNPPRLAGKLILGTVQFFKRSSISPFLSIFSNFEFFKWQILVIVMLLFCRKSCSLCRQGRWSKVILAVSWSWAVATCSSRKSADSSKPVSTDVPCAGICLKPQVVFFYHHALKKNSFNSGIIMINLWKRRHTQHQKYYTLDLNNQFLE